MIKLVPKYFAYFIVLVLLQVLILNHVQFSGFINPYIYILLILLLPFDTPGWLLLIVAFFLGLTIDMFSDTLGVHASATVFMAFLRPFALRGISSRETYESNTYPRIFYYGFNWFLKYTIILVFTHHLFLFFVENFKLDNFYLVLLRVILSTLFSTLLIVLSQYIFFRK